MNFTFNNSILNQTKDLTINCSSEVSTFARSQNFSLILVVLWLLLLLGNLILMELVVRNKIVKENSWKYFLYFNISIIVLMIPLIFNYVFTAFNIWGL